MRLRFLGWFLVAQALACLWVFRGGLWGKDLLAPLDIAPALFTKYRYMDPSSSGVPLHHHIIDQLTYDLPMQRIVYQSYQRNEMPWWDPYTSGGRPLLADAHISGTIPVRRLCYLLLPFELAYNWTRIMHYGLCGLGMCLLLRRLGCRELSALLLSLAYEFSGGFEVFFGHPWIQASFVYYPFLWLAWQKGLEGKLWAAALAALLIGAIFCAGNLQSHSYLPIFAFSFALGYAGATWRAWPRVGLLLAGTGLLGALLASPVLIPELELFACNARSVGAPFNKLGCLAGLLSLATCYPWGLGTFRTLDISKLFGRGFHLGFSPFIGCAAFFLMIVGAVSVRSAPVAGARRMALWLVAFYLVIISTPLNEYLYMRCVPLALMGLTVLAALGLECLLDKAEPWRGLGRSALALAVGITIVTNLFATLVYPRLVPKVLEYVERNAIRNRSFDEAPALRQSQVRVLPAEISFRNPEAVLGCAGLVAVGCFLVRPALRRSHWAVGGLLGLNLLPLLMYSGRAIPHHSVVLWHQLLAGGPEHQRVLPVLADTPARLWEHAPGRHEYLFPDALAALYHVRTVQTYSAVRPPSLGTLSSAELERWRPHIADWIYETTARGQLAGDFRTNATPGMARFQWLSDGTRSFTVTQRGLNTLEVLFEAGSGGTLLWADTFYPGWRARVDGADVPLRPVEPCFNAMEIPASARTLVLHYEPRFLTSAKILACVAGAVVVLLGAGARRLRRFTMRSRWASRKTFATKLSGDEAA